MNFACIVKATAAVTAGAASAGLTADGREARAACCGMLRNRDNYNEYGEIYCCARMLAICAAISNGSPHVAAACERKAIIINLMLSFFMTRNKYVYITSLAEVKSISIECHEAPAW